MATYGTLSAELSAQIAAQHRSTPTAATFGALSAQNRRTKEVGAEHGDLRHAER